MLQGEHMNYTTCNMIESYKYNIDKKPDSKNINHIIQII